MSQLPEKQGFSTVELLISLFVAAAFIGTAFQLFSAIMNDSNDTRLRAKAAGVINSTLQERGSSTNSPCNPPPATINLTIPTADLPQASGTVTFACPYGASSKTTRVHVVINYGSPAKSIEGSLDVTK